MAKRENQAQVQAVEATPVVKRESFFQKYKLAIVAGVAFVAGAAVEAIGAGLKQKKQLNLYEANDPLVEVSEPIEE